jgi:hypothetical protein
VWICYRQCSSRTLVARVSYVIREVPHIITYDELIAAGPRGRWWPVPSSKSIDVSVSMVISVKLHALANATKSSN